MKRVEDVRRTGTGSVVVTDDGAGHGRSALAAVRALAAAGYRPAVARSGPWSLAASSRWCVRTYDAGPVERDGYAGELARIARETEALAVMPSSDAALLGLGAPVVHLLDKSRLVSAARDADLPMPETRVFDGGDSLRTAADELPYPIVVKLAISRVPARKVTGPDELADVAAVRGPLLVQPFIDAPLWAVGGVVWNGRLVAAVHQRYVRTWPLDCGTASAALTIAPDPAVEERLVRLLEGYDGIFQAQFTGAYLLDLNPRVYGSMPLAVAAGVNLPAILCDLLSGRDVKLVRGRDGAAYRWVEGDVRALLGLVRRKELGPAAALRSLRPRRGSAHSVLSLRDPKPFLARMRYAARRR